MTATKDLPAAPAATTTDDVLAAAGRTDAGFEVRQFDSIRQLDSRSVYTLERVGGIAREVLDERIVGWTGEGWSTRQIAEEIGCDHSTVSRRQARLGVESKALRAGGQTGPSHLTVADRNSRGAPPIIVDDQEPVDGEVMPDATELEQLEPSKPRRKPLVDQMESAASPARISRLIGRWTLNDLQQVREAIDERMRALAPREAIDEGEAEEFTSATEQVVSDVTEILRRFEEGAAALNGRSLGPAVRNAADSDVYQWRLSLRLLAVSLKPLRAALRVDEAERGTASPPALQAGADAELFPGAGS